MSNKTYESGFVDGMEFATQLSLKKVLRQLIRFLLEVKQRRSLMEKLKLLAEEMISLAGSVNEYRGSSNGGDLAGT